MLVMVMLVAWWCCYNGADSSKTFAMKLSSTLVDRYKTKSLYSAKLTFDTVDKCVTDSTGLSSESRFYYTNALGNGIGKGASILIEIGFHDNKVNQKYIEDYMDLLSKSMMLGIEEYIKTLN